MKTPLRSAFTLVELLAVIVIISILVSLISLVAMSAIGRAKQTVIAADVEKLNTSIETLRVRFGGDYPPADLRVGANGHIERFVAKHFPRYTGNLAADLSANGLNTNKFEPDKALVFWLRGVSPDASKPFTGTGKKAEMEFDEDRLSGNRYLSTASGPDAEKAFLYFDFRSYGVANDFGVAPDATKKPNSFQIISSGLDAKYATGDDNITNYSRGKTLGELAEQ